MYKNIKISFLAISLVIFSNIAFGQEKKKTKTNNLNKIVEVTKRYSPKIGSAIKHDILPGATSKTILETPTFDYVIAYKPRSYKPKIHALESFKIVMPQLETIVNGYVNAAFGYPFQSLANAYYTTNPSPNIFSAVGVRHYGFWNELENNMGDMVKSKETQNEIFTVFDYKKHSFHLSGDLKYKYNLYDMNGFYLPVSTSTKVFEEDRNIFNIIDLNIDLGTPHHIGNQWDYHVNTNAYYLADNHDFKESQISIDAGIAKGFNNGKDRISLDVQFVYYTSTKNSSTDKYLAYYPKSNAINIVITPGYRRVGEISILEFGLGLNTAISNKFGDKKAEFVALTPTLRYELSGKRFNYFVGARSGYEYNTYHNLIKDNPYLKSGQTAPNSYWGDVYIGIEGTILSWLTWFIEGGMRIHNNMVYFYNIDDGNTFAADTADRTFGFINVSLSALLLEKLTASIDYSYKGMNVYTYAKHNFDFGIKYQVAPKWQVKLNGELISSRKFAGSYNTPHIIGSENTSATVAPPYTITNVPAKIYLSVGAEYKINDRISVTANLENIVNAKMYNFNNYRGIGISGMIGVTANF